ncbi:unnamed protein product [Caenorhabditis sp. 36 PRJEB53466]|nr:unnamed protein product [Caenorhabditis sp. 36 PRJEB53466]
MTEYGGSSRNFNERQGSGGGTGGFGGGSRGYGGGAGGFGRQNTGIREQHHDNRYGGDNYSATDAGANYRRDHQDARDSDRNRSGGGDFRGGHENKAGGFDYRQGAGGGRGGDDHRRRGDDQQLPRETGAGARNAYGSGGGGGEDRSDYRRSGDVYGSHHTNYNDRGGQRDSNNRGGSARYQNDQYDDRNTSRRTNDDSRSFSSRQDDYRNSGSSKNLGDPNIRGGNSSNQYRHDGDEHNGRVYRRQTDDRSGQNDDDRSHGPYNRNNREWQNRSGGNDRGGSWNSSRNDNQQDDRNDASNRKAFNNDGGYGQFQRSPPPPPPPQQYANYDNKQDRSQDECTPRDWMPKDEDMNTAFENAANSAQDLQIDGDQELEIRNSDVSARLSSWANSGFHPKIIANIQRLKYTHVRPIQAAIIPQIIQGYDVMGQAETSGGKTAAFGLPIVDYVLKLSPAERENAKDIVAPFALILAPTRELAQQIYHSIRMYAANTDIVPRLAYGQMDRRRNIAEIRSACDILVGTCGRIMDFIEKSEISLNFIKFLVLDEADNLLGEGITGHIGVIMNDYGFKRTDKTRQTIMTSATFNPQIERLAAELMRPVPGMTELVRVVLSRGRVNQKVQLQFLKAHGLSGKQDKLRELLKETNAEGKIPKTIVFAEQKSQVDFIAARLSAKGIQAYPLHGDRSQHMREQLIRQLRQNDIRVLVATDVAARGIDIPDLERVINFDLPVGAVDSAIDTFIHRTGRTGRVRNGDAISIIDTENERDRKLLKKLIELVTHQRREHTIPQWMKDAASHCVDDTGYGGGFGGRGFGGGGAGRGGGRGGRGGYGSSRQNFNFGGNSGASFDFDSVAVAPVGFGALSISNNASSTPANTVGGGFGASKVATGFGNEDEDDWGEVTPAPVPAAAPPVGGGVGFGYANKIASEQGEDSVKPSEAKISGPKPDEPKEKKLGTLLFGAPTGLEDTKSSNNDTEQPKKQEEEKPSAEAQTGAPAQDQPAANNNDEEDPEDEW